MKPTLWGLMALILSITSTALADYNDYDARGNFTGRVKSPYSIPPWLRTDSTGYAAPSAGMQQEQQEPNEATAPEEGPPGPWTGGIGGGIAPTASGFDASYSVGYGVEANVGLKLDSHWAFLLLMDAYSFGSTFSGWSANQFDLMPGLRYSFGGEKGIRPYLFAGVGGNDNLVIESNNSTINGINLAVAAGVGVAVPIASHLSIFVQGKYSVNYTLDGSFSYIPVSAGFLFN